MAKIRCLSRYRLQASDPRRKKDIPFKKWYFNPETKDMEISFKDGKEGLRWLANEVLKDTGINIKKILG